MCRVLVQIVFLATIFGCQANIFPLFGEDGVLQSKRHVSTLARDGLIPGKRYVSSIIKNIRPHTSPILGKRVVHPFAVFAKDLLDEEKRYIGALLAKPNHHTLISHDKRSLMDGMIFGEDMRRYLLNGNSEKRDDTDLTDEFQEDGHEDVDKRSFGVDSLVFGEDLRRKNQEESIHDYDKRTLPYPLLREGKRMFASDGLLFGEDMRKYLQQQPANEEKRGFNSLMDSMVLGEDLWNNHPSDNFDKRGYGLMDGIVFGEDLRNKMLDNHYYEKRGHGLMDGMVFAEDLRKAIQEASVRKDKEKQLQKLKDDKDLTGQKTYSKTLSKANGKRSVQALARNGFLVKSPENEGKRAGLEALARNGFLNGKQGKRAGLEALARNGYLNKCPSSSQSNKRGLSILAKNGLMPQKLNYKRDILDDGSNFDDNTIGNEDSWLVYYMSQRPFLPFVAKRGFLRHIPASATTKNIPFYAPSLAEAKKSYDSDSTGDDLDMQKRYVATLLKEASSPAKINIRDVQKSIEETAEEDDSKQEQAESNESKRDGDISEEYSMPVLQNSAPRTLEDVVDELAQLSHENGKRYFAVKGGGRILGGRLQEISKHKQNRAGNH